MKNNKKKLFAVLLFNTELELGLSSNPNKWINTCTKIFDNGTEALAFYINTPNPASQLIDALTHKELEEKISKMKYNYTQQKWLNENLYPCL